MSTPTHNRLRIENLRIVDYVSRVIRLCVTCNSYNAPHGAGVGRTFPSVYPGIIFCKT
jgi:hypothetical protein